MARTALTLLLIVMIPFIDGCARSRPAIPNVRHGRPGAWGNPVNGLSVGLEVATRVSDPRATAGEPVRLNVALENVGIRPLRLLVPRSLYLSSDEPADAIVVVRFAAPDDRRPVYIVGPGHDGSREVTVNAGAVVMLPGTIARGAWADGSDARLAQMRVTARYTIAQGSDAATQATTMRSSTAPAGEFWVGTASSGAMPILAD